MTAGRHEWPAARYWMAWPGMASAQIPGPRTMLDREMYRVQVEGGWLYWSPWRSRWACTHDARSATRLYLQLARELAIDHGGWIVPD